MDDVLNELEITFKMISTIPVTGDSVDTMSAARVKLRKVYSKLASMSSSTEEANKSEEPVEV